MNLALALPLAAASAVAYGVATAVQHAEAHDSDEPLTALLRNPTWWASIVGDGLGLILQIVALIFGPVVLVQPFFIMCLPIALPARARLGGPPVTRADLGAAALMVIGLAGFFALAGNPGDGHRLSRMTALAVVVVTLGAGAVLCLLARTGSSTSRAVAFSAVAGAFFGVEAVLVNAVSSVYDARGLHAFVRPGGLIPLVGAIVIGVLGFALTQVAFRYGALGASLPAMLVVDPLVAVLLGAVLLHQRIEVSGARGLGYVVCVAAVVAGTVRLANPVTRAPVG